MQITVEHRKINDGWCEGAAHVIEVHQDSTQKPSQIFYQQGQTQITIKRSGDENFNRGLVASTLYRLFYQPFGKIPTAPSSLIVTIRPCHPIEADANTFDPHRTLDVFDLRIIRFAVCFMAIICIE